MLKIIFCFEKWKKRLNEKKSINYILFRMANIFKVPFNFTALFFGFNVNKYKITKD